MGWIDFFLDGERLFLDVLLLKRGAEGDPHSAEFVTSLAYMGLVFDVMGRYKISSRYHVDAMRRAKEVDHPPTLANCYLIRGIHDYLIGDWNVALEEQAIATSIFWATGNLRYWGGATSVSIVILRSKGDAKWIALSRELIRIADETQDQQLRGLARLCEAREYIRHGAYETAAVEFEKPPQFWNWCLIIWMLHGFSPKTTKPFQDSTTDLQTYKQQWGALGKECWVLAILKHFSASSRFCCWRRIGPLGRILEIKKENTWQE
jgi:hypothetical protein